MKISHELGPPLSTLSTHPVAPVKKIFLTMLWERVGIVNEVGVREKSRSWVSEWVSEISYIYSLNSLYHTLTQIISEQPEVGKRWAFLEFSNLSAYVWAVTGTLRAHILDRSRQTCTDIQKSAHNLSSPWILQLQSCYVPSSTATGCGEHGRWSASCMELMMYTAWMPFILTAIQLRPNTVTVLVHQPVLSDT